VFWQVCLKEAYEFEGYPEDVESVVDCGANVGYASCWYLSRFPLARVVAVEPDPCNLEVLRMNLAGYPGRSVVVPAAVWARDGSVTLARHTGRRGEWARRVEAALVHTGDVRAICMRTLLDEVGAPNVDVLKVDIEGAEELVFASGDVSWLRLVRVLAIELHGEHCERALRAAVARAGAHVRHEYQAGSTRFFQWDWRPA
jgi:FkbM family methyltransferase